MEWDSEKEEWYQPHERGEMCHCEDCVEADRDEIAEKFNNGACPFGYGTCYHPASGAPESCAKKGEHPGSAGCAYTRAPR